MHLASLAREIYRRVQDSDSFVKSSLIFRSQMLLLLALATVFYNGYHYEYELGLYIGIYEVRYAVEAGLSAVCPDHLIIKHDR